MWEATHNDKWLIYSFVFIVCGVQKDSQQSTPHTNDSFHQPPETQLSKV